MPDMLSPHDVAVPRLGPGVVPSPLQGRGRLVDDGEAVLVPRTRLELETAAPPYAAFERAGPRPLLWRDPAETVCGIVTCGGLCPGLNNVIRALVLALHYSYGVPRVLGFRYGFAGLRADPPAPPLVLDPERVEPIHLHGGTLLGSSRGPVPPAEMVATLVHEGVSVLFTIGGDGTHRGALELCEEISRRGLRIAVVGVPKTIDNDLPWIDRSFGFATAVEEARHVIRAAHAEACGAPGGIGLVKLMGRRSGLLAAHASLASADVNFCLVPEAPFALDGEDGFLGALERRLAAKNHAVVVVAEGAGQDLIPRDGPPRFDASGNPVLADVGAFLRDRIVAHFAARGRSVSVKYIDPSYTIRSLPANATDAEFCHALGHHAAHAGLSGRTAMTVGSWGGIYTHVPLALVLKGPRLLDPAGETWQRVLESTGQGTLGAPAPEGGSKPEGGNPARGTCL